MAATLNYGAREITSDGAGRSKSRLRLLVACPAFGVSSEPWIIRQLVGFESVDPALLCWQIVKTTHATELSGCPVTELPFSLVPQGGIKRWIERLDHAPSGNFARGSREEERYLGQLLDHVQPDVVLAHFGHVGLRLLPLTSRRGVPLVLHVHGADVSSRLARDRWYRWSLQRSLPRFSAVVVVGSHQREWVSKQGVAEHRLHLIPCGVPVARFSPQRRPKRAEVRFITVCRLVPWKGVAQCIKAFASVHRELKHATLHVVGDGPERSSLEALAVDYGLHDAVTFTGALNSHEVRDQMQEADVFLQHSLTHTSGWVEGFGVSIAEAASMALPVVVTHSGGIPDQVIDGVTGYLVEERDVDAMARAMMRLACSQEQRRCMGDAGRARMSEYFDTHRQVARLERVLVEAATRAGNGSRQQ